MLAPRSLRDFNSTETTVQSDAADGRYKQYLPVCGPNANSERGARAQVVLLGLELALPRARGLSARGGGGRHVRQEVRSALLHYTAHKFLLQFLLCLNNSCDSEC